MLGEPGLNVLFSFLELNYKFEHTLIGHQNVFFYFNLTPAKFILFYFMLFLDTKYI